MPPHCAQLLTAPLVGMPLQSGSQRSSRRRFSAPSWRWASLERRVRQAGKCSLTRACLPSQEGAGAELPARQQGLQSHSAVRRCHLHRLSGRPLLSLLAAPAVPCLQRWRPSCTACCCTMRAASLWCAELSLWHAAPSGLRGRCGWRKPTIQHWRCWGLAEKAAAVQACLAAAQLHASMAWPLKTAWGHAIRS